MANAKRTLMDRGEEERLELQEEQQAKLAGQCFKVPFQGQAHIHLLGQIQTLRDTVDEDEFYSVYTALVQTSCTGKSRAVAEMSQLGIYICYCSCAGAASSAYPPRTRSLADKLQVTVTEKGMVLYFKAWLQVLMTALEDEMTAVRWMESQLEENKIATDVRRRWDELEREERMDIDGHDMDVMNEAMLKAEIDAISGVFRNELRVIFVFDEARGLQLPASVSIPVNQSPFHQARRALRVFFAYPTFFGLMLDTAAKVSNLMPRKKDEDSARATKARMKLLPPIYYLSNMALNVPRPGLSLEEYVKPETWLRYGRPIWSARMDEDTGDRAVNFRKLVLFARQKLVGDIASLRDLSQVQAMALLSATAGLEICPTSYLAANLAASHMNLVLRISDDRSMVFVTLPTEPILSEAAACMLSRVHVQVTVLKHLLDAYKNGYVTGGPRVEFVAKFILVAAMWSLKAHGDPWFLRTVPVADFLRKLLVNTHRDHPTFRGVERRLPKGGKIFFNAFIVMEEPPDVLALQRCFVRGVAIMYQADNNILGCDIIVPVWTPEGITCIVISVKNLKNSGWLESVSVEKLKNDFTQVEVAANLPVTTITMSMRKPQVAQPTNWLLWKEREDDGHTHLTCYGIDRNYNFLHLEVKKLLQEILVTVPDIFRGASNEQVEWVMDMLPERYTPATETYF